MREQREADCAGADAGGDRTVVSDRIGRLLQTIQRSGGVSLGYGPDDPEDDFPRLRSVRPVLSTSDFPR